MLIASLTKHIKIEQYCHRKIKRLFFFFINNDLKWCTVEYVYILKLFFFFFKPKASHSSLTFFAVSCNPYFFYHFHPYHVSQVLTIDFHLGGLFRLRWIFDSSFLLCYQFFYFNFFAVYFPVNPCDV